MSDQPRKPPLGATSRDLWLDARARDLSRAIHEYIEGGYLGGPLSHHITRWSHELIEVLEMCSSPE